MQVVLAGGGSAGHIEPALATADALRRHDPSVQITALGTERGLETRLVTERGYDLALVPTTTSARRVRRTCAVSETAPRIRPGTRSRSPVRRRGNGAAGTRARS